MSLTTRTSCGFSALPEDVEHEIFQYIRHDKTVLKACVAVCKDWDTLLTPDLFRSYTVRAAPTIEEFTLQLAPAPTRFTHAITELVVDGQCIFLPLNRLLALLVTYLPNVHTIMILGTYLGTTSDDLTFALPRKLSLRKLVARGGSLLDHTLDPLIFLLGHFERIDTLKLTGIPERMRGTLVDSPPFGLTFAGPWPALPAVKHLDIEGMTVDMALLERMARQPPFARNLTHLSLARSVVGCEQLAAVAGVLRAAQDTLRRFHFFPTFRRREAVQVGLHREGIELLAEELASCTALRELRLAMLSEAAGRPDAFSNTDNLAGTLAVHCVLIARAVQRELPITVDVTIHFAHNGDSRGFKEAMARLDWARLDKAAAGLASGHGHAGGRPGAPLTLWIEPVGVGEEHRTHGRRVAQSCFADWDWRRRLPRLTDPKDPKFELRWEGSPDK